VPACRSYVAFTHYLPIFTLSSNNTMQLSQPALHLARAAAGKEAPLQRDMHNRFSPFCVRRTCYQNKCLLFVKLDLAKADFRNLLQNIIHASL